MDGAATRITAEEFRQLNGARGRSPKASPPPGARALGRLPTGQMNQTEARYAASLDADPDVVWWSFEGLKFRLADNTFYTPDFAVMRRDGSIEAHEVKGHWEDDARVKIKVAAALFPVAFLAVHALPKRQGGGWAVERFGR